MNTEEFRKIIKRLQEGDKPALEQLYKEYFGKIYALALSDIRNSQDAYDIAMTVILKLSEYRGMADNIENHIGFIIVTTKNAVKDYIRHKKFCVDYDLDQCNFNIKLVHDDLWLHDILNILTSEEKEIFVMHIILDKSLKSIAKDYGVSYITIKRKYLLIKEKIKHLYQN